ncbi:multidrug and toxin extrusion protein 2-like isoform X12 [Neophocaena asiaeorientalis asiaeorientalis]|uniref:Multidrug and toxin extrusion protein n=1 Tax=Neophocaena asiaeorientalis asiaeorientalis TaxID=1706337 RepID=A0A341C2Y4_NEOAA|nr:multidrug and toxin extrusion protein 2-like isoform X12 [Neophocaena asiaeorientalis asiaeorientalis]
MEGCPTPPCREPAVPARPPALAGPPGQWAGARGVGADPLCFRASAAPTGSTWESSCSAARWFCCSVAFPAGRSSSTPSTSCCSAGRTRPCPGWPRSTCMFISQRSRLLAKYLQNQGITWPQVLSGVVGNCVNGLANYVLVSVLGLGVRGSACANTVSQFTQAVFLLLCVVKKKLHLDTWAGWSSQCLQGWGPFFRLAVPSMLMTCIEWWAYEIGSFLMGRLSVLDLSAQAIIYEVATVVYMIPMGLSIAVCFRVGTALGAADTVQAKRSAVSGTLCTVGTSLVVGTLLGLLRNKLGHIFTNDEEVVALVGKVLPLYVIFHLFEAVCCLYGGVLRGTGRQAFGAVVNAVTYYVVGLPLGVVLTFVVGLGITGLWLGMLACVFLAAAAFVTYTACMDWKRAAEEWSGACEVCLCVTTSCSACRAQLRPGWTAGRPDNSVSFRCRNVWGCRPRPLRAQPPASDPGLRERSYLQKGFAELCAISSCQVFSGRELPPVTDNRETTQKIKTQSW